MVQKKNSHYPLTPRTYFNLILSSIINSNSYLKLIPNLSTLSVFNIFILNIVLSSFIRFGFKIVEQQNVSLIFLSISQSLFMIPFALFWLVITGIFLHILAKILLGRGSFTETLKAIMLSTPPLLFIYIPYISSVALILLIYLLILTFKFYHQYSLAKAIVNIVLPGIVVLLFLTITGIIHLFFT